MITFIVAVLLFPFILIIALVSVVFLSILFVRAKRQAIKRQPFARKAPSFKPSEGVEIEAQVEVLQKSRVNEP